MSKLTPREILTAGAVVPVMAIDDLSTAVDLSRALVEGGIPTLEITLRTPVGLEGHPPDCQRSAQRHRRRRYGNQSRTAQSRRRRRRGFRHQPGFARIPRQSLPQQRHSPDSRRCHSGRSPTGFGTRHRHTQTLPCRSRWRQSDAQSPLRTLRRRTLLPDRRHQPCHCARLLGIAQRLMRRRLLADTERSCKKQRLGHHHPPRQRSGGIETQSLNRIVKMPSEALSSLRRHFAAWRLSRHTQQHRP